MKFERVSPAEIESRSFEIVGEELERMGVKLPEDRAFVIKRAIPRPPISTTRARSSFRRTRFRSSPRF